MKLKLYLIFLIIFFNLIKSKCQVTIANGLPGCLPVVSWVGMGCGGGTTFFGVNGSNQFQVQNVDGITCCGQGGDGESYFEFAPLDISNYSNVNISLAYSASSTAYEDDSPGGPIFGCQGSNPPDNSHDQILFTYSIDGGPEVQSLYVHGTTAADFTGTWMAGPLNGTTLTIKIYASNKATPEIYYFQNLLITATTILTAGPDKMGCANNPINLEGAGTGTWSGGLGVFGDINMPMTTYTPDASELNSTVVLTYSGLPAYPGCPAPMDQMNIVVNPAQDPTFAMADFCAPTSGAATGIITPGGMFSFDPAPGGGTTINPSTGVISNAVGGTTYSVKYVTPGPCPDESTIMVMATPGPEGTLTGNATLCPGECAIFTLNFTSGSEPYTINLTASPPGFPLPPIPGVTAAQQFTICYDGLGPLPSIDLATYTITIPTIFTGSGSLVLTGISDGSGCPGNASGSFSLTLTSGPAANTAGPLTACADANGDGIFDLTSLNSTVNGGNGSLTVQWFEDIDGTIPINNPTAFISQGGTVYTQVTDGSCASAIIPITLIVETGMVPFSSMLCQESGTDGCILCLTGGFVLLEFAFGDGNTYTVTVRDNSTLAQYTGMVSNTVPLSVPVTTSTVFELISIQPATGCPNFATYGDQVTITIVNAPDIDPITIAPSCQPITLPPITGTDLTSGALYYTGPMGTGTIYNPGDMIFSSQTLYIYDVNASCDDEEVVTITINPLITFDEIPDIETCVSAVLPAITGVGLSADAAYNTDPLGTGTTFSAGSIITQTTTLYIVDPNADPNCVGNGVDLLVTIHPLPTLAILSSISCTGSTGAFTVTSPVGTQYQYMLDGLPAQSTTNFTGISNGTHTITVINTDTNCERVLQFTINCDCSTSATVSLPKLSDVVCEGTSYTLSNIVFGGAANQVTLTSNGAGTLTPVSSNVSPFGFTYNPSSSDKGKVVLITITTNDPDGAGPCAAESVTFSLTIKDNPIGSITGSTVVCSGKDLTLTATGGVGYQWSNSGGSANIAIFNNITVQSTFFVTVTDAFGCKDTVNHTVSVGQISAGRDTIIGFCKSVPATVNLNTYLSPGATSGGIWKNGTSIIPDFANFVVTDLPLGTTTLQYLLDDPACGRDTALVTVLIKNSNNAGNDGQLIVCAGDPATLDFDAAIGSHDAGGTWKVVTSGTSLNLTNPMSVNVSSIAAGNYVIQYIIPNNGCTADTAVLGLVVRPFENAGTDVNTSLCVGSTVDLLSLVTGTNKTGIILNPSNNLGLAGNMWNTSGVNPGTYTFYYEVKNQAPCKPDTARISISLQNSLNPGLDAISTFCEGEVLDLKDFLGSNADSGGKFFFQNQEVLGGIFTPPTAGTDFIFTYVVGDDILCPKKSAIITLKKILKPTVTMYGLDKLCDGECSTLFVNQSGGINTKVFVTAQSLPNGSKFNTVLTTINQGGIHEYEICSSSVPPNTFGNWLPNQTVQIRLDSIKIEAGNGCVFDYSNAITFTTLPLISKNVTPTICKSDTYAIGNEIFSFARPSGTIQKPSINGLTCDSILNVKLSFYPDAVGKFEATYCDQATIKKIGNETFGFSRPVGTAILAAASYLGCDSIVEVSLKFEKSVIQGNYTYNTCNDDFTYHLGNQTFGKSNPTGTVLLAGAAAKGCDSLVNVQLSFSEFEIDETLLYTCDGTDAQFSLNLATHPGPYSLTLDGAQSSNFSLPYSVNLAVGAHQIIVTNADGCSKTFDVNVEPNNGPEVVLTQIPNGDGTVQINTTTAPNAIYNLTWTPANTLSCNTCFDPIANPSETTTYTLQYFYGNLCPDLRQITIERLNTNIVLPNIFSPNSDGTNDNFYVQFPDKVTGLVKSMSIYDRWGNLVFVAKNKPANTPVDGWNGDFGSSPAEQGVYVFYIEVQIDGKPGPDNYSGSVTLVR